MLFILQSPFYFTNPIIDIKKSQERDGGILKREQRSLRYNAAILCASNLGLQGLGFLYRIGVSRLAGAEGLGVYQLVYSVYAVMHAACLSGVTMACARLSAELSASGRGGAVGKLMRLASRTFTILLLLCAVFLFGGHELLASQLLADNRTEIVFPVMLLCLALTGIENLVKSICIGLGQVEWAASSELTEQIVRITAVLLLLYGAHSSDYGRIAFLIFVGMSMSECVSAALLLRIYRRRISISPEKRCNLPQGFTKNFLGIILPVTGAAVLNSLLGSASSVILPQRLMASGLTKSQSLEQLGILSGMAMPLLILPAALIGSVCTVLMPEISRSRARGDQRRMDILTQKAIGLTGLFAIPITALIVPLAPTLSRLFFGQPLALPYIGLLGISTVLAYYQMVTAGLLNGMGAQWFSVGAAVLGECTQLGLVWVLAAQPSCGVYGYIFAQICAGLLAVSCNFYQLCRRCNLKMALPKMFLPPVLCGVTVFFWVRVLYSFFLGVVSFQWLGVLCAAASAGLLCLGLLRLLGVPIEEFVRQKHVNIALLWGFY